MFKILGPENKKGQHPDIPPILFQIYHQPRREEIFDWLIRRGLSGRDFLTWMKFHHQNDSRVMIAWILKELDASKIRGERVYLAQ